MAKRFIDTNLFSDEWFCDLSKDCKLFFIYYITTCDHAGVLKLNKKLCEFQTKLKSIEPVIEELGDCLVTVKDGTFFLPKFIRFQYPNFPQSAVKQQSGAVKILKNLGFWDDGSNTYLTVSKESLKTPVNDTVIDNIIIAEKETLKYYRSFKHLKITMDEFEKIKSAGYSKKQVDDIFDSIENYKKNTSYTSLYLTALKWLKKEHPTVDKVDQCPYSADQLRLADAQKASGYGTPEWFDTKWINLLNN